MSESVHLHDEDHNPETGDAFVTRHTQTTSYEINPRSVVPVATFVALLGGVIAFSSTLGTQENDTKQSQEFLLASHKPERSEYISPYAFLTEKERQRLHSAIEQKINEFLGTLKSDEVFNILSNEVEYIEGKHPENYKRGVELARVWQKLPEVLKNGKPHLCEEIRERAGNESIFASVRSMVLVSLITDESLKEKLEVLLRNENKKEENGIPFPAEFQEFIDKQTQIAFVSEKKQ